MAGSNFGCHYGQIQILFELQFRAYHIVVVVVVVFIVVVTAVVVVVVVVTYH